MTCFFRRLVGLLLIGLAASDDESTASESSRPWRRFLPRRLLRCLPGGTTNASFPTGSAATVMSLSNVIGWSADPFAGSDGALAMLAIIRRLRYFSQRIAKR
uniref:Putative secreted protein n=1 Tax=Amblyomma americanum TaxID=6943 RepID=A0A0C9SCV0_AMBAM